MTEDSWTAHYWKYGGRKTLECDSLEGAYYFLWLGLEEGTHAGDHITGPDGATVIDSNTLDELIGEGPNAIDGWMEEQR